MMADYTVALAGSPNVGKSTLFNRLTGGEAHVANWPGVTLERFEGTFKHHNKVIKVVDLPGTYSLSASDMGELIAREFLINERPDVVVVVVDSTSLERTLYLALMVLEMYPKVVLALNMADAAEKRGIHVDMDGLGRRLGVPVVLISALKGIGLGVLMDRILDVAEGRAGRLVPLRIDYDGLEPYITRVENILGDISDRLGYPRRWLAIRLLEGDKYLLSKLRDLNEDMVKKIVEVTEQAERDLNIKPDLLAIQSRYELIDELVEKYVTKVRLAKVTLTERLDRVFLNPVIGPILATVLILSTFFLIFSLNTGFPLNVIFEAVGMEDLALLIEENSFSGMLGSLFDRMSDIIKYSLLFNGVEEWAALLISDGLVGSLGTLISFTPLLFFAYVILGAFEDSGIFARAAVVYDRLFRKFGLSGRAFFPAVLGVGCNVASVIATRAMDDDRERMVTAMASPLIPCQARLVVLLALAASAFTEPLFQAFLAVVIYLLSFTLFLVISDLLNRFIFKVRFAPDLLIELPPYHRPSLRVIWWYARSNTEHFLKKAGWIIVALGISTWLLLNFSITGYVGSEGVSESLAASLGKALSPITSLIGLGDWRFTLGFELGFVAKEGLIVTFSNLAGVADPVTALRSLGITPLKALSMALAMNFYVPCLATVAALISELRRVKYVAITVAYQLVLAFILAATVYWTGVALGYT